MSLFVISVTPDDLPEHERGFGYAVLLGDGILPGLYLGRYETAEQADVACRFFSSHYRLRGHPLDSPANRRAAFRVLKGGLLTLSQDASNERPGP